MMDTDDMPQYRSHKVVRAHKLAEVYRPRKGHTVEFIPADRSVLPFSRPNDAEVVKRCFAQERSDPGYFVVYQDGFESWSPTEAFEAGYTPVADTMVQPKLIGYRQLSKAEGAAINAVKEHGESLGLLIERLRKCEACDQRWISIGQTQLQQGIMALSRAIAKPDSF